MTSTPAWRRRAAAWAAMPVIVALVTWGAWSARANATTAGFLFLMTVLGLAAWGGWAVGVVAAVAATLCFNYFFLPPFGTLNIAEPSDWVALGFFLAAATFSSRLVATARHRAEDAQRRQREVEILYDLCFGLFTASQRPGVLGESAARTLRAIGAQAGLLLLGESGREVASTVGDEAIEVDEDALSRCRESHRIVERADPALRRIVYIPIEVGGVMNGVLIGREPAVPRPVLESAGRLLALAVERERLLAEAAHLEAVRESDALKTSLLRAVSHDLRTPLTSMRLEIEALGRHVQDRPAAVTSLLGVAREQERLARRIGNLLSMARLEAGLARPHPEAVPPGSLFRAARESLASVLDDRPVEVRVLPDCPDLWVDPSLALEMVVNLLENAARAAPPDRLLELVADGGTPGRVLLEVLDRGPGLPAGVRRLLQSPRDLRPTADRAAGDSTAGGLGLRIAASLAEANGGSLVLADRPSGGTTARLDLPAAPDAPEIEG